MIMCERESVSISMVAEIVPKLNVGVSFPTSALKADIENIYIRFRVDSSFCRDNITSSERSFCLRSSASTAPGTPNECSL